MELHTSYPTTILIPLHTMQLQFNDTNIDTYGFKALFDEIGADIFSCHIHHTESDVYWPHIRYGRLNFEHLANTPITRLVSQHRFTNKVSEESGGGGFADYFVDSQNTDEFTKKILEGEPFAIRENVASSIRIFRKKRSSEVTVFISFRSKKTEEELELIMKNFIKITDQSIDRIHEVTKISFLKPEKSLVLQNVFTRTLNSLASPLLAAGSKSDKRKSYRSLQESIQKICSCPSEICEIYEVERNGNVSVLTESFRQDDPFVKSGVVHFVAKTGLPCFIEDVIKYKQNQHASPKHLCRPKFVDLKNNKNMGCSFTYPVISGSKVTAVINIEAPTPNSIQYSDMLIIHHLASLIGTAQKAHVLASDLSLASDFVNKLFTEQDIRKTFLKASETIVKMGYESADFWHHQSNDWIGTTPNLDKVRKGGYTHEISQRKRPIIICNYSSLDNYSDRIGDLDNDGMFLGWRSTNEIEATPSKYLQKDNEVLCDVGFPIFDDINSEKGSLGEVQAVMWVKCKRYFVSMLDDEFWFLSLICRRISENLKRIKSAKEKINEEKKVVRSAQIKRHFGAVRGSRIIEKISEDSHFLDPRKATEIIVLNVDLRGSTKLCAKYTSTFDGGAQFMQFIGDYHNMVRDIILKHGGVFDKTMGDGVMGIFNVYRKDALPVQPYDQAEDSMANALRSVIEICSEFDQKIIPLINEHDSFWIDDNLLIGGSLVVGDNKNYIGSSTGSQSTFDFTVYGDTANSAGKLVDYARMRTLEKASNNEDGFIIKNSEKLEFKLPLEYPHHTILCSPVFRQIINKFDEFGEHNKFCTIKLPQEFSDVNDLPLMVLPKTIPKTN